MKTKDSELLDRTFMELAIAEASKSEAEDGIVRPKVGAIVVAEGKVLAHAYRGETGLGEHAEFIALERKLPNQSLKGATLFTTIEPCMVRTGAKASCSARLLERGISRVVIGMLDPDPTFRGGGILHLQERAVEVSFFPEDLLARIENLNNEFIGGLNL